MAEYLIQDTTLDAIADAINAKTGGSSAMTPAEMVTEIASISGGGGLEYEVGTLTTTGGKFEINHNLNTTKVLFFISPIDGNTYTATAGYQPFSSLAANFPSIYPFTATLNYSSYHGSVSSETAKPATEFNIGVNNVSPWTSQNTYGSPTGTPVEIKQSRSSNLVFNNNKISGWEYNAMQGTYKYCVISLEGVTL